MRRSVIKLSRRHEWTVHVIVALVFVSGAVWAWLNFFAEDTPAKSWMLKIHGAAAMATLIVIGTLLPYHVKFAWRAKRNRRTGSTMLIIFGFLILTGYGLYYAGDERLRAWTSNSHLYVGLALPFLLALHVWRGKKSRSQK
jgi:cation transport ATPase